MVMHVMMTSTSSVEEQLASLTRAIEGLTKYVQNQDAWIVNQTYTVDGIMDEDSIHAPRKCPQVQKTIDHPSKQVEYAKEIKVSFVGTTPINQIK